MRYICVLLYLLHVGGGSKVLVVFPVPSRSHTTLGDSVVTTLLGAGHEVTYVSPFSAVSPSARLTTVDIGSVADTLADHETRNLMELARNPRPPEQVLTTGINFAQQALEHKAVKEILHDPDLTFDVVIAEWYFTGLLAPLASLYDCPLIWYSALDANWMNLQLVDGQTNPAHTTDPQARSLATAALSLRDRLDRLRHQAYLTMWSYYMTYYVEASAYQEIYKTPLQLRARYPPNYEDVLYNASMLLINSHPLLGQTVALPANAKYVGGHHIVEPPGPLPRNLGQLLDKSKYGVIYFNLGSNVRSKDITEYMKMQLLDVFRQLEQTVVWEFEEPLLNLPRNVRIVNGISQTSILKHPNTVLFITHGGFISYVETVYFGVPVITIPIFGDQFLTAALATSRGYGIRAGFTDYLPYKLKDAIKEILRNDSYQRNTLEASTIMQKSLTSPQNELLYWIELVINRKTDHLRSPALKLTMFERLHLDVVAIIFMFIWFLSKVWKVLKVHWNSDANVNLEMHDKKKQ